MAEHDAGNRRICNVGAGVEPRDAARLTDLVAPSGFVVVPTAINYLAAASEVVEVTGTGGITVQLPMGVAAGTMVKIKNRSTGLVLVDGNGLNIDGEAVQPLPMQYDQLTVMRGTTEWMIE